MNSVLLGMQQDRATLTAGVIHGLVALLEYGRSVQNQTGCGRGDYLKADLTSCHSHMLVIHKKQVERKRFGSIRRAVARSEVVWQLTAKCIVPLVIDNTP